MTVRRGIASCGYLGPSRHSGHRDLLSGLVLEQVAYAKYGLETYMLVTA